MPFPAPIPPAPTGTLGRFVDSIDAAPTTRLNVRDGVTWRVLKDQLDFSPPVLRRTGARAGIGNGQPAGASWYENRVLRMSLLLRADTEPERAAHLEALNRELDRETNLFQWMGDGSTVPVFFRTMRSPDYRLDTEYAVNTWRVDVALNAEPFSLRLPITVVNAATVSRDPATPVVSGVGGQVLQFDVEGDVATPAHITIDGVLTGKQVIAVRRHGDVAALTRFMQAEAFGASTDTSVQPNSASMSGAGSNHLLTTFADTPGMTGRLVGTIMAANVESRGVYRVFARVLRSGAASAITVRTHVVGSMSTDSIYGPTRTLPLLAGRILVDLGLVAVPSRAEPSHGGYGAELVPSLPSLEIQAARASGAETLGWDYLVFVPADEELCISDTDSLPTTRVYDGPNDIVYGSGGAKVTRAGAIPQLQPGITNQLHIVEPIDAVGTFGTSTVTVKYWPRYLYVAS